VSTLELLPPADSAKLLARPKPAARPQPVAGSTTAPTAPKTLETQRALIGLLEDLLDITGVDAEDNFFALGGDSIISIKWSAQANAQGLPLTPPMVFEHMTIGELAAAVDAAADQPVAEVDSAAVQDYKPMSASGLSADALADLSASWHRQS
jgi:mycobactin peptide synthetase MbtE